MVGLPILQSVDLGSSTAGVNVLSDETVAEFLLNWHEKSPTSACSRCATFAPATPKVSPAASSPTTRAARNTAPASPNCKTYHPQFFSDRWDWLVELYGLPPIRLNDGRHEAESLALAAGVTLKAVQAMLGHTSMRTPTATYQTVLPEMHAAKASQPPWTSHHIPGSEERRD